MGILRSEEMRHGTLVIPTERAVEIVGMLGSQGCLQIQDMNLSTMRRPYRRHVQRLEEMERMLRYLRDEIQKLPNVVITQNRVREFLEQDAFLLEGVEESLRSLYTQFVKFRTNNDDLLKQRTRAMMERAVARVAANSLRSTGGAVLPPVGTVTEGGMAAARQSLLQRTDVEARTTPGFSSFAGVILSTDQDRLTRTLFRATRGNAFTHSEELKEEFADETGQVQKRNVFVVYYQGGVGSAMHEKISRICKAFGIEGFPWPTTAEEADGKVSALTEVIEDKSRALEAFEEFFFDEVAVLLQPIREGGNSLIEDWRLFCMKQKALFGTLNLFEETDSTLRADCWCAVEDETQIRALLSGFAGSGTVSAFLLIDKDIGNRNPPTYVKTTAFTECFQNFVDTYGVPRYLEANPAVLSTFTFPFLFGIMYGDIGHGFFVFFFGAYLIWNYKALSNNPSEVVQMIAFGRYMIFMMGCCAIYCGFIYNDFFSLGLNIFGSRYREAGLTPNSKFMQFAPDKTGGKSFPYPFGVDPVWKGADNELDFFNSFKMKASVVVAYVHMVSGIILKGMNAVYFKDSLTLWFEFLPQFIFFTSMIGYMDFLILFKWMSEYHGQPRASIISTLINMVMLKGVKPEDEFYGGQQKVELVLLILMVISVPWMLLPKPIIANILWKRQHGGGKRNRAAGGKDEIKRREEEVHLGAGVPRNDELVIGAGTGVTGPSALAAPAPSASIDVAGGGGGHGGEEFNFGEEMIHQVIETIEFAIGTISNTASYLRLWALSLAHQQLALVFFEQILLKIIEASVSAKGGVANSIISAIAIFLGFAAFAGATFGIMLCMDTLECYLHALRLHWVEFQNKFYKADGYKFVPFNFYRILAGIDY